MSFIAVLGATGHVGSHLARMLVEEGHRVRAVHLHGNGPVLEGVEWVRADLTDPVAARRVLDGTDAAYLAPPEGGPQPDITERRVARSVASAAAGLGLGHLVVHTSLHADRRGTGVPLLDSKRAVEEAVREAGAPWTVLRPGLFLDTLLDVGPHARRDQIHVPFPPGHRFGAVATRDVARAAAGLLEVGPQRRAFDLHLQGGTSGDELAYLLGEVLERRLEAREHPDGVEGFASMLDMNPAQRDLYRGLLTYVRGTEFVGEPDILHSVVPGFSYTSLRRMVHEDVLPRRRAFEVRAP